MIVIKHNIQISVRSIQNFGSEPEMILTKTTGSYCLKNGFHTISYYELDEYGNTTDNFISLSEKEMQIRKSGSFSGQFVFALDNRRRIHIMHYTGTIWRPPYEAYSALVQVTAGCTHHKCKFCTLYEDVPFKFRMSPLSEVEEDLKEISRYHRNAKRVFFTGANPFVLSFDKLKTLAELVKKYYPKVQSIGCFARITDITPKTTEQLRELRQLGYNSITIGAEAGDEESLSFMNKGFGIKEIIAESKRMDEVGMDYNFFYLAGIYGSGRGEIGAKNTAKVFNQVHPKIIVSSMLTIYPTSELYQEIQNGNWTEETEIEKLYELKTLIENLNIETYFATMGASNCINVEGYLPKDKAKMTKWLNEVIDSVDEKELRRYRENLRHL